MKDDIVEIDVKDLIFSLYKGYKIIIISVVVIIIFALNLSHILYEPVYETSASMVIHSKQIKILDGEVTLTNDVYLSHKMVNTYEVILLSDNVLQKVNEELNREESPSEMRKWISVYSPNDSEVINVIVKHTDVQLAVDIANAMMKVAPGVISNTIEVGSINVLDYAKIPKTPEPKDDTFIIIIIAIVIGVLIGVLIVLGQNSLFPKIKQEKDIVETLKLNVLGDITHSKVPKFKRKEKELITVSSDLVEGHFIESFKISALNLLHECSKKDIKTIVVTSSKEGEGKTTVTMNLAISLSNVGKSVLVIDGDFHKKSIYENELTADSYSLTDVLQGKCDYKKAIINDEKLGIDVLLSYKQLENKVEELGSDNMGVLLEELKQEYDIILIDTPPAFVLTDAAYMSRKADGVVLVIRQEHELIENIMEIRNVFRKLGVQIIGCILNDIRYTFTYQNYKSKYNSDYYNKKIKMDLLNARKLRYKKICFWVLLIAWCAIIGIFNTKTGEEIIAVIEKIFEFIIIKLGKLGLIQNEAAMYNNNTIDISFYETQIRFLSLQMKYWVQSFIYMILSFIMMIGLDFYQMKGIKKVAIVVAISLFFSLSNNYYQLSVFTEGYSIFDIIYSFMGMIIGILISTLLLLLGGRKERKTTEEEVV